MGSFFLPRREPGRGAVQPWRSTVGLTGAPDMFLVFAYVFVAFTVAVVLWLLWIGWLNWREEQKAND